MKEKPKILIVDDEPAICEQLTVLLSNFGFSSGFIFHPRALFPRLDNESFDLILLDLNMPEIDGVDLLQQLKAHDIYKSIPVVVLTSDVSEQLLARCLEFGAMDFVNKPVRKVVLKARIQSALTIKSQIQELTTANSELEETKEVLELANNDLANQNDLLQNFFESIAEGVVLIDSNYCIQMISAKACEMIDIPEQEAIGKPAISLLGNQIAGPTGDIIKGIEKGGSFSDIHTNVLLQNGQVIPVVMSMVAMSMRSMNPREPQKGWILLFQNIRTQERLLRENLGSYTFGKMIGSNPKMKEVFKMIDQIAPRNVGVLIQGESGTGKELVAKEIHKRSLRAQGPFHAVNCAAISPFLLESEFFGHERGAFTGAHQTKKGHFELANKGTLFLDEVGELPFEMQGKLLRVLQEQEFERVGGTKTLQTNVRVIAATNKNLQTMMKQKLFREDLFYRLHVILIELPPLRERLEDIPILAAAFMEELNKGNQHKIHEVDSEAMKRCLNYSWPGNIRELYHSLEHAFAICNTDVLRTSHFPKEFQNTVIDPPTPSGVPQNEKELILQALQKTGFNKPKALKLLGFSRSAFYRKLKKYGI